MRDRAEFLKNTELLSRVPDHQLSEIATLMDDVSFSAGTVIFRDGDSGDALYLVREGLVRVELNGAPVAIRRAGECFGEMALLDQSPRSSTLVAQTDVQLLRLPAAEFERITSKIPGVAAGIQRILTAKLRESLPQKPAGGDEVTWVMTQAKEGVPALPAGDLAGLVFAGRYRLEHLLGQGGMATVYRAHDLLLDVPVAVKLLHRLQEERILARFKQEVLIARRVVHPNVCRLFDFGEFSGHPYVSMEFIDGHTLAERIEAVGRLRLAEARPILRQVLEALEEIHKTGIIHRDIKPQNILVSSSGRAVVMDFGVALSLESTTRYTEDGHLIGTLHYMAPEQFGDGPVDARADLYAMGIVLFEVFTGQRPFNARSSAAIVAAHLNQQPPHPASFQPDIPPQLEQIILKALEKAPQTRYQSASELLADLERVEG